MREIDSFSPLTAGGMGTVASVIFKQLATMIAEKRVKYYSSSWHYPNHQYYQWRFCLLNGQGSHSWLKCLPIVFMSHYCAIHDSWKYHKKPVLKRVIPTLKIVHGQSDHRSINVIICCMRTSGLCICTWYIQFNCFYRYLTSIHTKNVFQGDMVVQ